MPSARRFPPPWMIDEHNDACFIVRDNTGQALGYFYFEDEPGRRSAAKLLTRDGGRMAANFAKLPKLLRRSGPSCVNAGYGADPPIPSICWPYEGSGPLSRAQEHLLQGLYTLLPSAGTVARIFGR